MPAWFALIVQVPAVTKVNIPPPVMVQTPGVDDVNIIVSPEVDETPPPNIDRSGEVPKVCAPGLANVITWGDAGVMALDAADGAPVPAELVAVTVKV